jgi:predicted TPR repeat methyltransferase
MRNTITGGEAIAAFSAPDTASADAHSRSVASHLIAANLLWRWYAACSDRAEVPCSRVTHRRARRIEGMTSPQDQSRQIFFTGVEHFEAGRLAQARDCFERCLALTPDRPSVLGNLGVTLFRLGHAREALPYLRRATAGDPSFKQAWASLGLACEADGQWAPATEALTQALALGEASPALCFALGQCLSRLGRTQEALQALDRALDLEPDLAAAWSLRGGLLREQHRLDAAAASFERAIALGADPALHAFYLASVRSAGPTPAAAPRQYVQALFDDYATDFRGHLVDKLGYRGHEVLLRPIVESGRRFRAVLDLGCGTGLCARLLEPCSEAIDGVDLSGAMLEQARRLGIYRELVHADLCEFLARTPLRPDLVVAADVLIYVGELSPVFAGVARILQPGGLFAFTVELPSDGRDLQLLPSLRYAHSEGSVRRLAARCGLQLQEVRAAPIRHEQRQPVPGLCVRLGKAAPA